MKEFFVAMLFVILMCIVVMVPYIVTESVNEKIAIECIKAGKTYKDRNCVKE